MSGDLEGKRQQPCTSSASLGRLKKDSVVVRYRSEVTGGLNEIKRGSASAWCQTSIVRPNKCQRRSDGGLGEIMDCGYYAKQERLDTWNKTQQASF